ncbi:c-type cytochrome [Cohnella herbarum]|uniref:Cytochrome c n=1 Tax=Cohnella herbarum TaxID=2728023 RepID=A0A7Z2ZJM7_9BACL|nr:cytochrome c [Cohnella herbarum]QJD82088.1 cytochrome c [Cohnella herbarum]
MRQKYGKYGFVIGLIVLLLMSACGLKKDDNVLQASITTSADRDAVDLYKQLCIACHASDLSGRVGPSLQAVGSRLTEEQLLAVIRDGSKGMPSYQNRLSHEELDVVVQWLVKFK